VGNRLSLDVVAPGSPFVEAGWRAATLAEGLLLYEEAGTSPVIVGASTPPWDTAHLAGVKQLVTLMGCTYPAPDCDGLTGFHTGMFLDDGPAPSIPGFQAYADLIFDEMPGSFRFGQGLLWIPPGNTAGGWEGTATYLVRDTAVIPEPGTSLLLAMGLGLLAGWRRSTAP
jgi:hypothetical protein